MNEDSPDMVLDDDTLNVLLERPLTELSADESMAIKAALAARGLSVYNRVPWDAVAPLMTAATVYAKAWLETLAKHHADALNDAVRTHIRKNGETRELLVGPEDGSAAILVVTSKTPDEARLALLDMDVTAPEVQGKFLRWDGNAMAWRAHSADS